MTSLICIAGWTTERQVRSGAWILAGTVWFQCAAIVPGVVLYHAWHGLLLLAMVCTWVGMVYFADAWRQVVMRAGDSFVGNLWRITGVLFGVAVATTMLVRTESFRGIERTPAFWVIPLLAMAISTILTKALSERPTGRCTRCSYDLHGLQGELCPECGAEIQSVIPSEASPVPAGVNGLVIGVQWVVLTVLAGAAWFLEPLNGLERLKPDGLLVFDVNRSGPSGTPSEYRAYLFHERYGRVPAPTEDAFVAAEELVRRAKQGELAPATMEQIVNGTVRALGDPFRPAEPWCQITVGLQAIGVLTREHTGLLWDAQHQCTMRSRTRAQAGRPIGLRFAVQSVPAAVHEMDAIGKRYPSLLNSYQLRTLVLEDLTIGGRSIINSPVLMRDNYTLLFDAPLDDDHGALLVVPSDVPAGSHELRARVRFNINPDDWSRSRALPFDGAQTEWVWEHHEIVEIIPDRCLETYRDARLEEVFVKRLAPRFFYNRALHKYDVFLAMNWDAALPQDGHAVFRVYLVPPDGTRLFVGPLVVDLDVRNGGSAIFSPTHDWWDTVDAHPSEDDFHLILEPALDLAEAEVRVERVWEQDAIQVPIAAPQMRP